MRFLLDENTDLRLAPCLVQWGHDVTAIALDYTPSLSDRAVLAIAYREGRILITSDRGDFGDLIFRWHAPHCGVIVLNVGMADLATKQARLEHVLTTYADQMDCFLVVSKHNVRVRS